MSFRLSLYARLMMSISFSSLAGLFLSIKGRVCSSFFLLLSSCTEYLLERCSWMGLSFLLSLGTSQVCFLQNIYSFLRRREWTCSLLISEWMELMRVALCVCLVGLESVQSVRRRRWGESQGLGVGRCFLLINLKRFFQFRRIYLSTWLMCFILRVMICLDGFGSGTCRKKLLLLITNIIIHSQQKQTHASIILTSEADSEEGGVIGEQVVDKQKDGCSEGESMRQTRLPCRCYPITVPGRFFSLLCCQSRAYESFQSPRPSDLRPRTYGYPKLDTGTRQTGNLSKSSTPHHLHTTTMPVYRMYPGNTHTLPPLIYPLIISPLPYGSIITTTSTPNKHNDTLYKRQGNTQRSSISLDCFQCIDLIVEIEMDPYPIALMNSSTLLPDLY